MHIHFIFGAAPVQFEHVGKRRWGKCCQLKISSENVASRLTTWCAWKSVLPWGCWCGTMSPVYPTKAFDENNKNVFFVCFWFVHFSIAFVRVDLPFCCALVCFQVSNILYLGCRFHFGPLLQVGSLGSGCHAVQRLCFEIRGAAAMLSLKPRYWCHWLPMSSCPMLARIPEFLALNVGVPPVAVAMGAVLSLDSQAWCWCI